MNNHSVLATSNKCEFQNYFSDPLKVDTASEIAMTKAVMSVPVRANQYLTIPKLTTTNADFMDNGTLEITIDGIRKQISYNDIYDSYKAILALDPIESELTKAEFYSGDYILPLSNFIVYFDIADGTIRTRPNINDILAHAFNAKFSFFNINSSANYEITDSNNIDLNETVTIGAKQYRVDALRNQSLSLGFSVNYEWVPNQFVITPCSVANDLLWAEIADTTVTDDADGCTITSNAGTGGLDVFNAIACLNKDIGVGGRVDPNGGLLRFRFSQMGTGPQNAQLAVGFSYGLNGGVETTTSKELRDIVFGVFFENNTTTGDLTIQVVDGDFSGVDNTGAFGVGEKYANLVPANKLNTAIQGEYYFIRMIKGANYMPNRNEFSFQLYVGTTDVWDTNDNPTLIYNSTKVINTPLDLVPIFIANRSNVQIDEVSMVKITDDSRLMLDPTFEDAFENHSYPSRANTMEINYNTFQSVENQGIIQFWQDLGFSTTGIGLEDYVEAIAEYTYNYNIERIPSKSAVAFGNTKWDSIYFNDTHWGGNRFTIGYRNLNATLPRMLEVRINDLNVVTSSGSFVGSNIYDDNVVNRIVGTIPVPSEYLDRTGAFNMDISYEPYNLIYRSLRNVNDIMVNQLNIKVSAKNFETNTEDDIKNINGTLKLEFHIKKI